MEKINILYLNFWPDFDSYNNKFTNILSLHYDINIIDKNDDINPDLLIYSYSGQDNIYNYNCVKLYITGENDVPDFNVCDYAISASKLNFGNRHLYIPYFALTTNDYKKLWNYDRKFYSPLYNRNFCSCVVGNVSLADPKRIEIINAIESYKPVAYGGKYRNNVGGCVENKWNFICNYKFNIATENSKVEGYITEKIVDAFITNTIPIYWGANDVSKIFNPESFINANDYNTINSLVNEIKRLDTDNDAYMKMVQAPHILPENKIDYNTLIEKFLCNIIDNLHIKYTTSYGRVMIMNYRNSLKYQI